MQCRIVVACLHAQATALRDTAISSCFNFPTARSQHGLRRFICADITNTPTDIELVQRDTNLSATAINTPWVVSGQ